jgi:hypothetical protein
MDTKSAIPLKAATEIQSILYGPYVSFILYAALALLVIGIFCKINKLSAVSGLVAILIVAFRMFSNDLFSTSGIFQTKVIIPIFVLTLLSKFVSDYVKKKRKESAELETEENKSTHKRRSVTSERASGGLTRFGDSTEKKYNYGKSNTSHSNGSSLTSGPAASSAPIPKLNRNF